MTILFAGTEADAFKYNAAPLTIATAGYYDATYVRQALSVSGTGILQSPDWTPPAGDDTWLHFEYKVASSNASTTDVTLVSAGGVPVARFVLLNSVLTFQYWNGTTWVSIGPGIAHTTDLITIDLQYKNAVSGRMAGYINTYLVGAVTGDFSALADATHFIHNSRGTNPMYLSQVLVADEPTLGFHLAYRQPTGAGNYTAWAGTWDEVDAVLPSDSSFVSSSVADQRETFTKALFTVPGGLRVKAVGTTARARRGATGLQNLAMSLRFGSTDYDSADKALGLDFNPVQAFWHNNPATSLEWTPADAGSITVEFGLKART